MQYVLSILHKIVSIIFGVFIISLVTFAGLISYTLLLVYAALFNKRPNKKFFDNIKFNQNGFNFQYKTHKNHARNSGTNQNKSAHNKQQQHIKNEVKTIKRHLKVKDGDISSS